METNSITAQDFMDNFFNEFNDVYDRFVETKITKDSQSLGVINYEGGVVSQVSASFIDGEIIVAAMIGNGSKIITTTLPVG